MHTYEEEQILIRNKVIIEELMTEAYMPLQDWISNNQQFNEIYEVDSNPT